MTIKEFSQKYSLVLFWVAVVLFILLLLNTTGRGYCGRGYMMMRDFGGYEYDRYNSRNLNNQDNQQRQIMNPNNQNQPLINNTPNAAGTVETGASVNPNIPVEVQ